MLTETDGVSNAIPANGILTTTLKNCDADSNSCFSFLFSLSLSLSPGLVTQVSLMTSALALRADSEPNCT